MFVCCSYDVLNATLCLFVLSRGRHGVHLFVCFPSLSIGQKCKVIFIFTMANLALVELQCSEAVFRTVIQCEELTEVQKLHPRHALGWHPPPQDQEGYTTTMGHVTTEQSAGPCCDRREVNNRVCCHADEALSTSLRQLRFEESMSLMNQRVDCAKQEIRKLEAKMLFGSLAAKQSVAS